jgi:hypothetical protein
MKIRSKWSAKIVLEIRSYIKSKHVLKVNYHCFWKVLLFTYSYVITDTWIIFGTILTYWRHSCCSDGCPGFDTSEGGVLRSENEPVSWGGWWWRLSGHRKWRGARGHTACATGTGRAVPYRQLALATALCVQDVYFPHLLLTNFVVVILQHARDTSIIIPSQVSAAVKLYDSRVAYTALVLRQSWSSTCTEVSFVISTFVTTPILYQ